MKTAAYSSEQADGGSDNGKAAQSNKHDIVLEDRKSMTLTGIEEVDDFSERKIVVLTEMEQLTITGSSLHIASFRTNTGELRVKGTIDSLVYADKKKSKMPFFK